MKGTFGPSAVPEGWFDQNSPPEGWFSSDLLDDETAVTGTMAATEAGADTFAGSGTVAIAGALAATEAGSDTLAGVGAVAVAGALSAAENGADGFAASGTVAAAVVSAVLGFFTVSRALAVLDAGRRLQMFAVSRAVEFEGETMSLIFPEVFDPSDVQSYTFDMTGVLEASENIATATVALASGTPSALTIGTGGRAPVVGTKTVQFWLQSNDATMQAADAGVVLTVTTNASPSRTLQRTGIVQVRQR